jgi:hypothetical protein
MPCSRTWIMTESVRDVRKSGSDGMVVDSSFGLYVHNAMPE